MQNWNKNKVMWHLNRQGLCSHSQSGDVIIKMESLPTNLPWDFPTIALIYLFDFILSQSSTLWIFAFPSSPSGNNESEPAADTASWQTQEQRDFYCCSEWEEKQ